MVLLEGIEPSSPAPEADALSIEPQEHGVGRIEPAISGLGNNVLSIRLPGQILAEWKGIEPSDDKSAN